MNLKSLALAAFVAPNTHPHGWDHTKRAGSSSGGGGGGGRGSTGSTGSSGGSKGTPNSGGSSGSSGSTSSGGKVPQVGSRQGTTVVSSSSLSPSRQQYIWGSNRPAGGYGYNRPYPGSPALIYGFWPIYWLGDTTDGAPANNDSRPGGPLMAAGLQAPQQNGTTYVLYGDSQSVMDLIPTLNQNCSAVNASSPSDLSGNTTVQMYREDSFALYALNMSAVSQNTSFVACLNATIGNNILVSGGNTSISGAHWACLAAAALGFAKVWA